MPGGGHYSITVAGIEIIQGGIVCVEQINRFTCKKKQYGAIL